MIEAICVVEDGRISRSGAATIRVGGPQISDRAGEGAVSALSLIIHPRVPNSVTATSAAVQHRPFPDPLIPFFAAKMGPW
jgi:hypothetical protein